MFSLESFDWNVKRLQFEWDCRATEYVKESLLNLKDNAMHLHVYNKQYEVTLKEPLFQNYFARLSNGQYAAVNGWIKVKGCGHVGVLR